MPRPRVLRLPTFGVVLDMPDLSPEIAKVHLNRFAKKAMKAALEHHHKKIIPQHFRKDAARRYKHTPRQDKYNRLKDAGYPLRGRRYTSTTDLVLTGRTRAWFSVPASGKITVGGSLVGGKKGISGKLAMKMPFRGGSGSEKPGQWRGGVTPRVMKAEYETMTRGERAMGAGIFHGKYWGQVAVFRKRRKRKKTKPFKHTYSGRKLL